MILPFARLSAMVAVLLLGAACTPEEGGPMLGRGSAESPMTTVVANMPNRPSVSAGTPVFDGNSLSGTGQPAVIRVPDARGSFGGVVRPIEPQGGQRF